MGLARKGHGNAVNKSSDSNNLIVRYIRIEIYRYVKSSSLFLQSLIIIIHHEVKMLPLREMCHILCIFVQRETINRLFEIIISLQNVVFL